MRRLRRVSTPALRLSAGLRSLATNVPLAVLSLALAATLWVAVTNEENPTLRQDVPFEVPVEEVNIPRPLTVTGRLPDKVRVTLIGARDQVSNVRQGDLTARVDLSGVVVAGADPQGAFRYTVPVQAILRRRGVRAEVKPQTVEITLEPITKRVVPVRIHQVDTLPLGFEALETPAAQPTEVTISGAKEFVDPVEAVVANVKFGGQTVSFSQSLPLDPEDSAGHSIGGVSVDPPVATITVKLRQVIFTRQILVDPRIRGRPAAGYTIQATKAEPVTVNVLGSITVLNQIPTAPTQDVDVEGATSDVIRTVGINLPNGASLAESKNTVVVTISIQPARGPGSIAVAPRLLGLQSGLTASIQALTVAVSLSGPIPILLRLTPADVTVTLDAGGLGPGTYRLEPKVSAPAGIQVDTVTPDRVGVLITAAPPR